MKAGLTSEDSFEALGTFWADWYQAHAEARHVPVDYVAHRFLPAPQH